MHVILFNDFFPVKSIESYLKSIYRGRGCCIEEPLAAAIKKNSASGRSHSELVARARFARVKVSSRGELGLDVIVVTVIARFSDNTGYRRDRR